VARAYVLGPPSDLAMLGLTDSASDTYGFGMDAGWAAAGALQAALDGLSPDLDPTAPFDASEGVALSSLASSGGELEDFIQAHYRAPALDQDHSDQSWRRIDNDWLGAAAQLALQLDDRTNNTSLVLAIEVLATKEVMLFAADAQIGNWRSWPSVKFQADGKSVSAAELLARTVFYKVGHHGSANATRRQDGLEAMTSPDFFAFIPTDEVMAKKVGWGAIPASGVVDRLQQKAGPGGVVRSDQLEGVVAGKPKQLADVRKLFIDVELATTAV
jgi:hypothetical protein